MTPWVTRLLAATVVMFLVSMSFPIVQRLLLFVPALVLIRPWSIVTYMFLHADLGHLFFNMLALYFFGPRLEARLGARQFLWLYFASGIMGALLSFAFTPSAAIIGASGAVFGVLYGFAHFWPRERIFIWGVLPIEARWLVTIAAALSLWFGFRGGGGIAHFAHLGGFVGGFLYLKWIDWRSPARRFRERAAPSLRSISVQRWTSIQREDLHEVNRDELDRIMEKLEKDGVTSLTPGERMFLDNFSSE